MKDEPKRIESSEFGLSKSVLSPLEILAQSVAGIAPSAAPALTLVLVFAQAGNGSWLAYLIATCAIILTALNLNIYSTRSASPGSLYAYAKLGAGPAFATLCGLSLICAYTLGVCIGPIIFTIFANEAIKMFGGTPLPPLPIVVTCTLIAGLAAYRNIKLSTELMLWTELISMSIIVLLCTIVLTRHGWQPDMAQLTLSGVSTSGLQLSLILALLSFVGFESAASLGAEAETPLENIPKALLTSTLLSGVFFMFTTYTIVYGFQESGQSLGQCSAPLVTLSTFVESPWLGALTIVGAMVTFFASTLACINTGSRILLAMSHDGFFPGWLKQTHPQNHTPHKAIIAVSVIAISLALVLLTLQQPLMDIVAWGGTIATFGIVFSYIILSVCVPFFLHNEGTLKVHHIALAFLSTMTMGYAFLGTIFPIPPAPYCWLPYVFLVYLALGWLRYMWLQKKLD